MAEQIDRKLNLVLTYPREKGALYVHATAIGLQVFERYYRVLARTFSAIYTQTGGITAGPRIAALELKRAAAELAGPDPKTKDADVADIQAGLIAEMQRLSSVIVLTEKGWETIPYHEAVNKGKLSEREASEVENALAFFTVASWMHRVQDLTGVLGVMDDIWGARIVSSNSTEYAASLPTSTPGANTGAKAAA